MTSTGLPLALLRGPGCGDGRGGRIGRGLSAAGRAVADFDEIAALPWAARARVPLAAALRAVGDVEAADRRLAEARDTARVLGMARLLDQIEDDGAS